MLFFFGFLCKFFLLKEKKKILRSGVLLCFFGFLLGGANFMTSLTCVLVSSLLALFLLLQKKGRRLLRLLAPVLCLYSGFLLACLAPGNRLRQTGTKGLSPLQAVLSSFRHIFTDVGGDFLSLPVILLLLLLLPLLLIAGRQAANACAQNHPAFFRHPLLTICLCLCLSASNITPPLYATANIDAGRIRALMWEQFILLLVLCLFIWQDGSLPSVTSLVSLRMPIRTVSLPPKTTAHRFYGGQNQKSRPVPEPPFFVNYSMESFCSSFCFDPPICFRSIRVII